MAQSVNLWGATYSDVPAIEVPKSGGGMASFTDVTDTTAAASDVATGKYFYTAAGVRTQGTGSGGAGAEYTRTVIAPQQTVSPSSAMQQMTLTSSGLIEDAKSYIVTVDNVEWLTTCETLWSANYCIGDVRYFLEASPSSAIYPFGAICENGVIYACFATTGSHTIKIERLDFVTGGTTLTTKNITANGTYNASSDSADGYSSVVVNVSGGGGGDAEDGIIERTISGSYTNSRVAIIGTRAFDGCASLTSVNFPNATIIGEYAFSYCTRLKTASFPNATTISIYAFNYCTSLTSANFPSVTSIGGSAFYFCTKLKTVSFPNATSIATNVFYYCSSLTTVNFPSATYIGANAFRGCEVLATASFPNAKSIGNQAFRSCSNLMSVYILASSVATLGTSVFLSTPMSLSTYTGSFGSIYVPASLVSSYQTATNWKSYSARITSYVE